MHNPQPPRQHHTPKWCTFFPTLDMEVLFLNLTDTEDRGLDTGRPREACVLKLGGPVPRGEIWGQPLLQSRGAAPQWEDRLSQRLWQMRPYISVGCSGAQSGTLFTINKPTLTLRYHPNSIVYIRVNSWCFTLWIWKMGNDIYPICSIIWNSFTGFKILCPIYSSLYLNPRWPLIFSYP